MAFITEKQLEDTLDVPINLPLTQIVANDWLIVATVNLSISNPTSLTLRWLQLRTLDSYGAGSGSLSLGLFKDFNLNQTPWTQTPVEPLLALPFPVVTPTVLQRNAYSPLTITASTPGIYSFVLGFYLTTTPSDPIQYVRATVNGQLRIDINPT